MQIALASTGLSDYYSERSDNFLEESAVLNRSLILGVVWGGMLGGLLVGPAVPAGAAPAGTPAGQLIEAEDPAPTSTHRIVEDAQASGGKAVTSDKPWEPVFVTTTAAQASGPLTVWVRRKGGPLCLKAVVDGKQQELKWDWSKPEQWTWTRWGRYEPKRLGSRLVLIRGDGGAAPQVDCVVLAPEDAAAPGGAAGAAPGGPANAAEAGIGKSTSTAGALPPEKPDPALPPRAVAVAVDWAAGQGRLDARHWGVNDYEVVDPRAGADAGFQAYLQELNPRLVRIHHAALADRWTDAAQRTWDWPRIDAGLAVLRTRTDAQVMVNLASWPRWLHEGSVLPAEKESIFIELVADLVGRLAQQGRPVRYWELLNEKDNAYEKAGRMEELWVLWQRLARAARAADPQAKIGGPALTWPKPAWLNGFLEVNAGEIDFISWHNYASGEPTTSNEELFTKVEALSRFARDVRQSVDRHAPGRPIELFLTEYNVQWVWQPFERRHANSIGAAFQASVVAALAPLVDGITVWHLKGNAYGLIDGRNHIRPSGWLYRWAHQALVGERMQVAVEEPGGLQVLAVRADDQTRAVLLVNTTAGQLDVPAASTLLDAPGQLSRIDAEGAWHLGVAGDQPLALPGYSLTLLTTNPAPSGSMVE